MKFIRKMPRFIETALQALKKIKAPANQQRTSNNTRGKSGKQEPRRRVSVMTAQSLEEVNSAPSAESLDEWD